MKFGKILHCYGNYARKIGFSVGEAVQTMALENLYNYMKIPDDEIVFVDICDLASYNGEYVLLPMYGASAVGNDEPTTFPISPKIIPVILSSHLVTENAAKNADCFLRTYAPIGCRDEFSLKLMRSMGIPAYLSGCISITLDKRTVVPQKTKVFLVDIPDSLLPYIPKEVMESCEIITHQFPFDKDEMTHQEALDFHEVSKKIIARYRDEATLVVSSRLHAIAPCIAMGIPVIMAVTNCSWRFSWIDRFTYVFTPDKYSAIDWNPSIVDFENHKTLIRNMMISQIKKAYERFVDICMVSDFYESRNRSQYGSYVYGLVQSLEGKLPKDFKYIVWGCGRNGEDVCEAVEYIFPEAQLIAAVDQYKRGLFRGKEIVKHDSIPKYPDCYIFLANFSGKTMGYEVMKKLNKIEYRDFLFTGTING